MKLFLQIFAGFWVIWIIWYLTGGPLRDNKSKPFVGPDTTGAMQTYGTSTGQ